MRASRVTSPDARGSLVSSIIRFAVTGALSVTVDVATLAALHSGAGVPLAWATILAYGFSLLINYRFNRQWTFQSRAAHRVTAPRYATMVAVNIASTLLLVLGLTSIGLYYLLSKLLAIGVNAIVNFIAGRYWIFPLQPAEDATGEPLPETSDR